MAKSVKMTIAEATKKILVVYPYIDEFMRDKCVNYSALANRITPHIQKMLGKDKVNKEAVIMSIIRYAANLKTECLPKTVLKTVAETNITLKTDMMYLNIPKTINNLRKLERFYSLIKWDKGEIFFLVQGVSEISIVVDKSNYDELKRTLSGEEIELQFPLSSIVIMHSPPEAGAPGFIHFVTKEIAKAGISIEMLTLTRDTIFIVDQENSTQLFEILKNLVSNCRELVNS